MGFSEADYTALARRGLITQPSGVTQDTQERINCYALPEFDPYANQLERDYASLLGARKQAGDILDWKYQPLRLLLAYKTSYTPDFVVVTRESRLACHEVKGFWREDARVKIKVAARLFPWFSFCACQRKTKKAGWTFEEIEP